MADTALLLDDGMRRFVVDGYLLVKPDVPRSVHEGIHLRLQDLVPRHGSLGNNLLPLIPEIRDVFDAPAVHGALTGILGHDYVMHTHRYCHTNRPGSKGQDMHKDSYEGDEQVRHHRCRWAMAFYYPQDTSVDMGPTAILPASQYYDSGECAHRRQEVPLSGEAGTVAIVHYDLWHRAMPNESERERFMLKFLFARLEEPQSPSWNNEAVHWQSPAGAAEGELEEAYRQLWNWNRGSSNGSSGRSGDRELTELIDSLGDEDESVRLDSAYALGSRGAPAVPALIEALDGSREDGSHPAAFALAAIGKPASAALIEALAHKDKTIRACAAYALGDIPPVDTSPLAVEALTRALSDNSEWVRRNAAEALGAIGQPAPETVAALEALLSDNLEWIRDNAVRALAKIGPAAEAAVPTLVSALRDKSRYVRFHAGVALRRIDTDGAREALYEELLTSRWCPVTTDDSPF
ncbi:MAG TPA: phytanoyl-CoA dioxygenase [Candidatus Handelsmanbacteria bacterium]|nr:phytanoyl-CoA dioxygenase [Candidatus Handelsmanbacteria bacterium]